MKKTFIAIALTVAVMLTIAGCGGSGGGSGNGNGTTTTALKGLAACATVAGEAVICGTAFAPDGQTPIVGAEVSLVVSANETTPLKGMYKLVPSDTQCLTDAAGQFACSGISSSGTLNFQIAGSGYTVSFSEDVLVDSLTDVATSKTTATSSSGTDKYAVIGGAYDSIENVLARIHGCGTLASNGNLEVGTECSRLELVGFAGGTNPNTVITSALGLAEGTYPTQEQLLKDFLASATNRAQFKAIFLNCSSLGLPSNYSVADQATIVSNLQAYVSEGGNLYASDWMYPWIEQGWPEQVDWYGDDTSEDAAQEGNMSDGTEQPVNVLDADLLAWLQAEGLIGSSATTFDVDFDLPGWVVMLSAGTGVTTVLDADSLIQGISGETPYNPGTQIPISLVFPYGSGCVFYTSYHNEPEAEVEASAVQTRVLEYMVFNRLGNCQ